MADRDKAVQRLRDASWRLTRANEELDAAERELVAASLALDEIEQRDLPSAADVRGILPAT